jgi:hypothetical protein
MEKVAKRPDEGLVSFSQFLHIFSSKQCELNDLPTGEGFWVIDFI